MLESGHVFLAVIDVVWLYCNVYAVKLKPPGFFNLINQRHFIEHVGRINILLHLPTSMVESLVTITS